MTVGWSLARAGERCGSCRAVIPAAAPVRRLTSGLLRCAPCAKQWLNEEPPPALLAAAPGPVSVAPPAAPAPVNGVTPVQALLARWRTRLGLDVKMRAAGDES